MHNPRLDLVEFKGLNADNSFVLPAFTFIEYVVTRNLASGMGGYDVQFRETGQSPFAAPAITGGLDAMLVNAMDTTLRIWPVPKTIELHRDSWTDRELDMWIILNSLGEH